jgi:ethanolamine utilization microcompartment shell protein EutL
VNKVYYLLDEVEVRRINLQNSVIPLLKEDVCFLKGNSEAELDYMMKCLSRTASGLNSPGVQVPHLQSYVLADRFTSLVVREKQ